MKTIIDKAHWLRHALPALSCILLLSSPCSAQSSGRNLRVLATCIKTGGQASADFVGNQKHARVMLSSTEPDASAGFEVEGLTNLTLGSLNSTYIAWEPPAADAGTFFLRIKTTTGKVQRFTIGPTDNTNLPNLATDVPGRNTINIQRNDVFEQGSTLTPDDVVAKWSVYFSANKKQSKLQKLTVDDYFYNLREVPILLQTGDCSTLF